MPVQVIQGIYYLIGGLWPVFNVNSFEKVTGEKTDKWLVKSFGLLMAAIGIVLIISTEEMLLVGVASAAAIGLADAYYSLRGRISKVYLLDAAAQALFIIGWVFFTGV